MKAASTLALAALLLAGCGSTGDGPPGAGTAAGSAAAASATSAVAQASKTASAAPASAATLDPPAPPAPAGLGADSPGPSVRFNVQDADPQSVLDAVSALSGHPVQVDAAAKPYLRCARATVLSADPIAPGQILVLLAASLRPSGLIVTDTGTVIHVSKAPDAPAKPCAKG